VLSYCVSAKSETHEKKNTYIMHLFQENVLVLLNSEVMGRFTSDSRNSPSPEALWT
jgi:hypothetical protein